ncbi:ferritin-like domain-containing protein [Nocardia sp. CA-107356]|uniref:ferritin-like domain-containing protein n=1 Tax=Nocardia sp. CA-107356 TaxID=3239972 RepID=UPI003D929D26
MSTRETTLLAQLRAVLGLTNTEIHLADTRIAQARTAAVRRELSANADRARARAKAIAAAIGELGGVPEVIGPFLGRAVAAVKTLAEQAQPFEEALLGDLTLEHQLLDRARYIKALATTTGHPEMVRLAERLITAHTETVDWLTTVLAEDALGGPAALRRTPLQAATGTAVKLFNLPADWSARGLDRAMDAVRTTGPALGELLAQGTHAGDVAVKTLTASRDAALATAEEVTRREGADTAADALRSVRAATGVLDPDELPISDYPELNLTEATTAIKDLTDPADIRAILTYEQANKNRQGVLTAARNRLTTIAKDITGIT